MNRTGTRRSITTDDDTTAPVELPHVLVTVADDGTLTATVDGTPFEEQATTEWTRATFGPLMDAITRDRTIAVRVEVRENDGASSPTSSAPASLDAQWPRPRTLCRRLVGVVTPAGCHVWRRSQLTGSCLARMSPSRRSSPIPTPPGPAKRGRSSTLTICRTEACPR